MDLIQSSPYHPLEQSERRFRLLRLLESDTDRTRCEIKSFSLLNDDLPAYKALSYRWGEGEPEFTVHLNDHPVPVRNGLRTFLTQMVAEKRQDWYFIDALCIDQDNEVEKSCQVQQMGEIYRRAEEVVVWIVYEPFHYEDDEDRGYRAVYDPHDETHNLSSLSRAKFEVAVLGNSYWSRLWILQEVLLAKTLTIRIGSKEVDWLNLLPEKTFLDRKGLPDKNDNISNLWQSSNKPFANITTALNILSYRRFKTKSLRAGNHLPFHKVVDFFAMQHCARPHDKVFGYLGLTNSRIQIDYSTPILDLFVATLADYLLSAGFITEDLTRFQFYRVQSGIKANDLVVPLLAFGLNPCEPVVHLLVREVARFFAPGFEDSLTSSATMTWWNLDHLQVHAHDIQAFINSEHKFELKYIGSTCVKFVKFAASATVAGMSMQREMAARLRALEKEDAVMSAPGGSDGSKTYSQWAAYARAISEQIWQRFMESGEDAEGDIDDESWTLIA